MRWMNHRCTITFHDPPPFDIKHVISDVCAGLKPAGLGGIIESPQVATGDGDVTYVETTTAVSEGPRIESKIGNVETLRSFNHPSILSSVNSIQKMFVNPSLRNPTLEILGAPKHTASISWAHTLNAQIHGLEGIRGWWRLINFWGQKSGH